MKATEYAQFVMKTDQYKKKSPEERRAIALYGLVGEIGSLVAAVKKKILAEGGEVGWDQPNEEIKEEVGDVLWYSYSLAQIVNDGYFDILSHDIAALEQEVGGENERARRIADALDPTTRDEFLIAAHSFPPPDGFTFDDYQRLAFKTARTDGRVLLEVCLAVLFQLGAELLRKTLPEIELSLNRNVADRPPNTVLGEITWHLAAMASIYHLSMDEVVAVNLQKVNFRAERGEPTPLHDCDRDDTEKFPRKFDVSFVRVSPRKSRMYVDGARLGDDLTDNTYEEDGYRFHDVLHLAFVAHLGWSPVVRSMMKKKRKSRKDGVDENEDGARAKVVEELLIKAIHSEGVKQARESGRCSADGPERLFPEPSTITFRLLKTLRSYVENLEVWNNAYWEWEGAVYEGCEVFSLLRKEKQGTVNVDLVSRTLTFVPTVSPEIRGATVGMGMAVVDLASADGDAQSVLSKSDLDWARVSGRLEETVAAKFAIIDALGLAKDGPTIWELVEVKILEGNRVSVKPQKAVQDRIWESQIVDFKIAFVSTGGRLTCTAAAIADVEDLRK